MFPTCSVCPGTLVVLTNVSHVFRVSRLTAVYLACKVEEFYVPISQFVSNLKGNREKFADTVLTFELLLMSKLRYHLTVHNPFRALEGLLIDVKTRFPDLENAERLRKNSDEFLVLW
eukprot:TRINITY_DN21497_c0_g1_i12.p1 TRINITY_DN21497_c0_g1~~TRINITY_DN21497_c0_g1_i12.p1  ORF type:complete len:117 (+),score=23.42 TRINITY_DN21497_c0_g1_i12:24-374(+)